MKLHTIVRCDVCKKEGKEGAYPLKEAFAPGVIVLDPTATGNSGEDYKWEHVCPACRTTIRGAVQEALTKCRGGLAIVPPPGL